MVRAIYWVNVLNKKADCDVVRREERRMKAVNAQKIHEASMRILNDTGMKFHHPDAVRVLKENGVSRELRVGRMRKILLDKGMKVSYIDRLERLCSERMGANEIEI